VYNNTLFYVCNKLFIMQIPIENVKVRFFESIYKKATETTEVRKYDLARGRKTLVSEDECNQYLVVYGGMHYHKLVEAYKSTKFENIEGRNVEIIDWGSGIATASCILIDHLIERKVNINIVKITLIEPSIFATNKGRDLLQQIFQDNREVTNIIRVVNKNINKLTGSDFETNAESIKVHLFSNIIDVQGVDLRYLFGLVTTCFQGKNRLICTSPKNDLEDRTRLDTFFELFADEGVKYIEEKDKDIVGKIFMTTSQKFTDYNVTRYEKQFTIDLTPF
jgi:hypothetical protein